MTTQLIFGPTNTLLSVKNGVVEAVFGLWPELDTMESLYKDSPELLSGTPEYSLEFPNGDWLHVWWSDALSRSGGFMRGKLSAENLPSAVREFGDARRSRRIPATVQLSYLMLDTLERGTVEIDI